MGYIYLYISPTQIFMLNQYLKDRKPYLKSRFKNKLGIASVFAVAHGAQVLYQAVVMDADGFEYTDFLYIPTTLEDWAFEIGFLALAGIAMAIAVTLYDIWHYYKSYRFFNSPIAKAFIQQGFEIIDHSYLQGNDGAYNIRIEVVSDRDYFNSILISFWGAKVHENEMAYLLTPSAPHLYLKNSFVEIVNVNRGEELIKEAVPTTKVQPVSGDICLFMDKAAGTMEKFAFVGSVFNRYHQLKANAVSLGFNPISMSGIEILGLNEFNENMNHKYFKAT